MRKRYLQTTAAFISAWMMMFSIACADETIPNIWQVLGVGVATEAPTETPQPTITPSPDSFRFRDGIRWGMNPQQVKALESENMVAFNKAKDVVDHMMNHVTAILTAAVNGEDPDTYDPDAACTGDCCSCGGCH